MLSIPPTPPLCAGVHDDEDPEYSILKHRLVNKMKEEGTQVGGGGVRGDLALGSMSVALEAFVG